MKLSLHKESSQKQTNDVLSTCLVTCLPCVTTSSKFFFSPDHYLLINMTVLFSFLLCVAFLLGDLLLDPLNAYLFMHLFFIAVLYVSCRKEDKEKGRRWFDVSWLEIFVPRWKSVRFFAWVAGVRRQSVPGQKEKLSLFFFRTLSFKNERVAV